MKPNFYTTIALIMLLPRISAAQLFTKVTTGPVVTTPGDSRSVNFIDVNNDGWDDLFISNGPEGGDHNFLYMNNGDGSFAAVSGDDLVTTVAPFDGATFGDFDNDGDHDAYVVTWYNEKNHFYVNNGNGTFTENVTIEPAIPNNYAEAAAWGDYNHDGWLDLYISTSEGNFKNLLYRNEKDGSFFKITSGDIVNDAFATRGVTWIDYDLDGDADLYAANESQQANNLYRNNGDGTLTKVTTGPHVNDSRSSMSASWGDIDQDGDPDLYVANSGYFVGAKNQLFINQGDGSFSEATTGDAVTDNGCSYSSSFEDYDNDGDLDLAVSNGFCNGSILNFLYLNDGKGNFTRDLNSISDLSTPCSYGCAFGDANNDGFPDLVFATCDNSGSGSYPTDIYYLNNGNSNHWLKVLVKGTVSNRSAVGGKLRLKAVIGGEVVWQYREVTTQSGYCSQNSFTQHFGLGDADMVDSLVISFPGGNDTVLTNISVDQTLEVTEASVTGMNEQEWLRGFRTFPNPNSGAFMVEFQSAAFADAEVHLSDIYGKRFWESSLDLSVGSNAHHFSFNSLPGGIYFLEIVWLESMQRMKVVVE